jgi:oxygen-dependent protoporphyrinogen oxidase
MIDVVVVGGGITGLATAWYLRQADPDLSVALLEASDRLGGKIETTEWMGVPLEAGPDTFLARVPAAVDLCHQLGLGEDLVAPATWRAYVWTRGRLRPLPEGHVLGVPGRLGALARSGVVSRPGLARAGLDLVLPRHRFSDDPSVAEVVGARFGREVVDRLVDPMLGGIHAGTTERLSLASVAPAVAEVASRSRSLLLGLRGRVAQPPSGPLFLSLRGGLGRMVERLVDRLEGVDVRCRVEVESLAAGPTGGWRVGGLNAASVVLTVPAFVAAPMLSGICPAATPDLEAIRYASVVTVTFAYRPEAVADRLDGSGFLVPAVDGRLMTACTWLTAKWPDRARSGRVLLRASAGRVTDQRALGLDDQTLAACLHRELAEAMGLREEPEDFTVARWPRAFPQYDVGHGARVARMEAALAEAAPGVTVAGAAYHGLGIAACIQQAEAAAARTLKQLLTRS